MALGAARGPNETSNHAASTSRSPLFAATLSLLAILLGGIVPAFAGAALEIVRADQTALFGLLQRPHTEQQIEALLDARIDYPFIAERESHGGWAWRLLAVLGALLVGGTAVALWMLRADDRARPR